MDHGNPQNLPGQQSCHTDSYTPVATGSRRKLLREGEILAPRDADDGGSAWFVGQKAWVVSSGQRVETQSSADGCPVRVFAVRFGRPWGRVARGTRNSKGVCIERSNFGVEWGLVALNGRPRRKNRSQTVDVAAGS